jgi:hypothetical protein
MIVDRARQFFIQVDIVHDKQDALILSPSDDVKSTSLDITVICWALPAI